MLPRGAFGKGFPRGGQLTEVKAFVERWTDLGQFVKRTMDEFRIAGVAVAVSRDGETCYTGTFGTRNQSTGEPVTPHTIFGLASVSKSFTAMGIMSLADKGLVSRDDPVVKHLPEFSIRGIGDMAGVRLHHLMSHSTGLPPFKRRQGLKPLSEHVKYIAEAEYELLGKPGDYFSYCNDAFIVLGAVIERVTGKPFAEYIRQAIFEPAGLCRATYDDPSQLTDVTELYVHDKAAGELVAQNWPDLGNYHVSGGVRASISDLIAYTNIYTNDGMANGRRVLSCHSIRCMRQPVVRVSRDASYAYGLRVTPDYCDLTLVEHGGSLPGVSSHFGYVPEHNLGVAVLTNVSAVPVRAIWMAAVNAALGFPLDRPSSVEPVWEAPEGFVERYAGTYRSAESGDLRIFVEDGVAKGVVGGEQVVLRPSDDKRLVYRMNGQDAVLRFYTDRSGEILAVLAGSRMFRRVKEV